MLSYRKATANDAQIYFNWVNDSMVREQSFNSTIVDFISHKRWFSTKLNDENCTMLVFQEDKNTNIGQVRIQKETNNQALIGISICSEHRGKGYAKEMLIKAANYFFEKNSNYIINAYIKEINVSSKSAFEKAGFQYIKMVIHENFNSFHYIKKK
jgi:RimJ/RimL family protein N-acetyltransferase